MKVLLAFDGSAHSRAAETLVAGLRWPPGSSATVLGVVRQKWSLLGLGLDGPAQVQDTLRRLRRVSVGAAQAVTSQAVAALSQAGLAVATAVLEGEPGDAIEALAGELRADLIVLGAQGYGPFVAPRLGSTAWQVLHAAQASVLIARPSRRPRPVRIVLAADGLLSWLQAESWPISLLPDDADITIAKLAAAADSLGGSTGGQAGAASEAGAAEVSALELGEALQARGLTVRNVFPLGEPRAELVRLAHTAEADLVIVGGGTASESNDEAQRNMATATAKYAPCSVLVVRAHPGQAAAAPAPPSRACVAGQAPAVTYAPNAPTVHATTTGS
jgi:nucleotide-binding universal stress UspA family protein